MYKYCVILILCNSCAKIKIIYLKSKYFVKYFGFEADLIEHNTF